MSIKYKFEIEKLKGKLGKIREWMRSHHIHPRILFYILGIISTIWFLIRVIPKPGRAAYPCMRVAAPFMSGLIIYLLAVAGITMASRKTRKKIISVRYASSFLLVFGVIITMAITPSKNANTPQNIKVKTGPDDGPNQPMGKALGINPGRVIWAWDPKATNENCTDFHFKPENNDQKVISGMFSSSVKKLAGKKSVSKSWDAMFRYFNTNKKKVNKGYTRGEKIFIKINQTSGRGRLNNAKRSAGDYNYPAPTNVKAGSPSLGTCETTPFLVLELLRQLVNECGIKQSDIAIGDPQNPTYAHNYEAWSAEFPNIVYTDKLFGTHGRTLIHETKNDLIFYSDKYQTDKFYDVIENADYMINVANLKPHSFAGITLTAKNHFGSQSREMARHLHYSHVIPLVRGNATNSGYRKYRVFVDIMGSKYLGQNTLLYVVDGLFGGGSSEGGPPVRYFSAPFNNDWSNSILISQDQVALESVCYDILRTEWNGTYKHDSSNNRDETTANINGVDDYLHQAAESSNWPKGIIYDPDNSGKPIPSLGVHEHWNNPESKQYSRNLGKSYGIELISIPENIVGSTISNTSSTKSSNTNAAGSVVVVKGVDTQDNDNTNGKFKSVVNKSFNNDLNAKKFYKALADDNGVWFLTDIGIVNENVSGSFTAAPENNKIPGENLNDFAYELSNDIRGLIIAASQGAAIASLPMNNNSAVTTFNTKNSAILSDTVFSVLMVRNNLRWFGTSKGISATFDNKWLTPAYHKQYPESLFKSNRITDLATTLSGDTLYVATEGAGVARVYIDKVDAISGASEYAIWGPIEMPSDKVYSLCITNDGTQWLGTDLGAARHTGYNTLENWTIFNTENGLIDNFVQAIAADNNGKLWFGTKGGLSVFDGTVWTSYTTADGLISNNILCIFTHANGTVYLGTDAGLMIYNNGHLVCYKSTLN
jgi:hypothetical protein